MICQKCGLELPADAQVCPKCGAPVGEMHQEPPVCPNCGAQIAPGAVACGICGMPFAVGAARAQQASAGNYPPPGAGYTPPAGSYPPPGQGGFVPPAAKPHVQRSRLIAVILALLFGTFGLEDFYLGDTSAGIAHVIVSVITGGIGGMIWGYVNAIRLLTKEKNTDAKGFELKDFDF